MPINYTISIDDRAVLIVVRQYDSAGGEVSIANINVPESDAELQRAADQHEQENACNWDNVSSLDFDGCNGCKFSCALGHFPNRSVGD